MSRDWNLIDRISYMITMLESGSFDIHQIDIYQKHLNNTIVE
ncbi:MAG TPA: hypothetical protein VK492_11070 [Chitinophagaceae bacterium]|nr:hypothetical protein [Chitinophagaceae bacterium]